MNFDGETIVTFFPQSLQANTGLIPKLRSWPHSSTNFPIPHLLLIQSFDAVMLIPKATGRSLIIFPLFPFSCFWVSFFSQFIFVFLLFRFTSSSSSYCLLPFHVPRHLFHFLVVLCPSLFTLLFSRNLRLLFFISLIHFLLLFLPLPSSSFFFSVLYSPSHFLNFSPFVHISPLHLFPISSSPSLFFVVLFSLQC